MIKLLGLLPAASRIKSIEFAKVKASFGGTEDAVLFFHDKASRRIFTDGRASRAGQTQYLGTCIRGLGISGKSA